ncbi:hypothetical protein F383_29987 [Gossypium arboreum]|uniref:Uncharacterized protein n=1 Tax=Gossypium arboreum TaxID=29729 RepID=A0A0B0P9R2_GOSAR|nr:hypothetical protein F383_29987 [Gossypium arboreum]
MDRSAFLKQFLASSSASPLSPLLGCIYRLWNAYEPSKVAFSD